jgi:hypothetical protein
MKLRCGLDYIRDKNWKIREFKTIESALYYGEKTKTEFQKRYGFVAVVCHGLDGDLVLNYARSH